MSDSRPSHDTPEPDPSEAFAAAVDAAFAASNAGGTEQPTELSRSVRAIVEALRDANAEIPSAWRHRAVALFRERPSSGESWLATLARVLLAPASSQPALAGFRGAAEGVRSYRADIPGGGEAWIDVEIHAEPTSTASRRLRGHVAVEGEPGRDAHPIAAHAVDPVTGDIAASALVRDDGMFVLETDRGTVDLVVELDDGARALVVAGVVTRA